jgi:large subunit ribosomal protein L20
MSRTKGGTVTHARHKKVIEAAKGYYGARPNTFRTATQAVDKANQYATRDRKNAQAQFPRAVDPADQRRRARP